MHFRMLALAWGLAVAALVFAPGAAPVAQSRAVSVTIDDLPTVSAVRRDLAEAQRITHELTAALRRSSVPAIGFVNEGKLRTDGKVDPARVVGVGEHADVIERHVGHESFELRKVRVGFTGETDNECRAQGDARHSSANPGEELVVGATIARATHAFEHCR
jgi:hypothetical protein